MYFMYWDLHFCLGSGLKVLNLLCLKFCNHHKIVWLLLVVFQYTNILSQAVNAKDQLKLVEVALGEKLHPKNK